jgi:hypothetical protein
MNILNSINEAKELFSSDMNFLSRSSAGTIIRTVLHEKGKHSKGLSKKMFDEFKKIEAIEDEEFGCPLGGIWEESFKDLSDAWEKLLEE